MMFKPPAFGDGQRIGLFGGSFNPTHYGHYMVALFALKRLPSRASISAAITRGGAAIAVAERSRSAKGAIPRAGFSGLPGETRSQT